jgi:hypothetical protein
MFKTFPIVLDITKHQLNDMFQVNSNDLNTVKLSMSIKSGLDIFDLTGKIVRIAIKKPDGYIAFQTGGVIDPSNGLCEFILDRQAYLVEGKHEAEVMIYQDDSTVIVTERFYYKVNRAIANDKTLLSTNHLPAINQAIIAGEQLKDIDIPEFVEAANGAFETIEEAETQGIYAKDQGDYAKQEGDKAAVRITELNGVDAVQFKSRQDGFDVKLVENDKQIKSQYINVMYPPSGLTAWNPNKTDAENTTTLQNIINYASTNNMIVFLPSGTYRTTAPLVIPTKQGFEMRGAGNRYTHIDPQHSGNVIEIIDGQSHVIKDIKIHATNALYKDLFTGIYVKNSLLLTFDNIHIFYPKNGVVYEGSIYVCDFSNLYVYYFKEKGIYFKKFGTGSGSAPNGNRFDIKFIRGQGKDTPNSYGIYLEAGSVNTFSHGQVSDCDTAIYQAEGYRNYYEKFWLELCYTTIEILSGNAYVDCHGAFLNKISDGAILFNYNGQSTPYLDLTRDQVKEDKNLKAMWFFNEGSGSRVLDKSGNKKHITLAGTPTWTTDGTWGTAVYYKYSDGRTIPIPLNTVDWSQPFTYMINYSVEAINGSFPPAMGLYLFDSATGNYFAAGHTKGSLIGLSYMGGVLENPSAKSTGRSGQQLTGKNIYEFVYVDPINKTIEALDPFANSNAVIQMANSFTIPNPTLAVISGRNHVSNTAEGNISMSGFWQRKLSLKEVYDIVNNNDRPFKQFDKKVQLSTTLVSPDGSDYKITVGNDGALTTTKL